MKNLLILLFVAVFAISCTPQKRLQKLLNRHPELLKFDTINDTLTRPAIEFDSAFTARTGDTVFIVKNNVKTEFRYLAPDSFYISTLIPADTIFYIKEIEIPKPEPPQKKEPQKNNNFWLYIIGLYMLIIITIKLLKK